MVRKLAIIVLVGVGVTMTACNTVRGAAADVNSAANCTQNAMNGGNC